MAVSHQATLQLPALARCPGSGLEHAAVLYITRTSLCLLALNVTFVCAMYCTTVLIHKHCVYNRQPTDQHRHKQHWVCLLAAGQRGNVIRYDYCCIITALQTPLCTDACTTGLLSLLPPAIQMHPELMDSTTSWNLCRAAHAVYELRYVRLEGNAQLLPVQLKLSKCDLIVRFGGMHTDMTHVS